LNQTAEAAFLIAREAELLKKLPQQFGSRPESDIS